MKHDLQKHTLNLYQGDWDELRALFPEIETSVLIRELVRTCINNTKSQDPEVRSNALNLGVKL